MRSRFVLFFLVLMLMSNLASAQSSNVAIIGGPYIYSGGELITDPSIDSRLAAFTFTTLTPSAVSAATLAPYDTVVLNMQSSMSCNSNTFNPQQKADLIAFVNSGKKLIIYDSECSFWNGSAYVGVDYSWLPFPFTTANPGALGAQGTLNILEGSTLGCGLTGTNTCPSTDPYFIDAAFLSNSTDAVGDMNVMTTNDPNWCVALSGTNALNITGPVHTYAKYPALTDKGLIIYNGLDLDYAGYYGPTPLTQIWILELQQPFNPSNLPCGFTVIGITLSPSTASNIVGSTHTVTATLKNLLGDPQAGVMVTFTVVSGPNAGVTGSAATDSNGEATFSYAGTVVGTDMIEASFSNQGVIVTSQQVEKIWLPLPNIDVAIDIKAGSCPNPLNMTSKGVIPVAILGSATFDVTKVDFTTVKLEGVSPRDGVIADVATPFLPIKGRTQLMDCTTALADGYPDLQMHFDTKAVAAALATPVTNREVRVLHLVGNLKAEFGGTKITGEDVMILLVK